MEEKLAGRSTAATSRDVRFEQLVSPWMPEMYRLAAAICGIGDADDVTQDALVDAWRGFDRLRDEARVRAWLHSIVVSRARKHLRFRRFRPRTVEINPELTSYAERDPSLSVAEHDRLDRAFDLLPVDQRACIALHHSIGASVPEIAVALGIPEATGQVVDSHPLALPADYSPARLWVTATIHNPDPNYGNSISAFDRVQGQDALAVQDGQISGGYEGGQGVTSVGPDLPLLIDPGTYALSAWVTPTDAGPTATPNGECSTQAMFNAGDDVLLVASFDKHGACSGWSNEERPSFGYQ